VQASPKPIILFIDEAHTLVGAGGAAGTGDAANLLKPALARGTLRTIGATTLGRVQEVHREGPGADPPLPGRPGGRASEEGDADDAQGVAATMEKHHKVQIARRSARVRGQALAPLHPGAPTARQVGQPARHRVRAGRDQPARVPPAEVDDSRRRIQALETELEIIAREKAVGRRVTDRRKNRAGEARIEESGAAGRTREALGRGEGARREVLALRAASCAAAGSRSSGTGSKARSQQAASAVAPTPPAEGADRRPIASLLKDLAVQTAQLAELQGERR
jgi:type VI secretion system protein VasG